MGDIVVVIILLVVIGAAVAYIIREKKKGVQCIGCRRQPVVRKNAGMLPGAAVIIRLIHIINISLEKSRSKERLFSIF